MPKIQIDTAYDADCEDYFGDTFAVAEYIDTVEKIEELTGVLEDLFARISSEEIRAEAVVLRIVG